MKQFFKIVFATMIGAVLSAFLLGFFAVLFLIALISSADKDTTSNLKEHAILQIQLSEPVPERTSSNPFKNFDFANLENTIQPGLNDILKSIRHAKTDPKIDGIYLAISDVPSGLSTIEEIRNALIDFKKSSKFIVAYSEFYSQKAYYLASVANKIYLNPKGLVELRGFKSQVMFLKGALDKLEIEPEIIRVGSFKSAVEPYMLDKMSDSSKLQSAVLLNSIFQHVTHQIAKARDKNPDSVIKMANDLLMRNANDALKIKMVDGLKYYDEVLLELKTMTQQAADKNPNFVGIQNYSHTIAAANLTAENKIAVIYASGEISGGQGDDENIGSDRIAAAIRKARLDKNVKAIVLRVNSPGGSALASDIIWREVILAKKEKPVVASMGDVAASGGYYIACGADAIIAEPTTITGSIGVFAVLFNAQNFFKNKLGITFDGVKTSPYADLGDYTRPLTESERAIIQHSVNTIYADFIKVVSDGRKMDSNKVLNLAGGRVWSGINAKELGLVDGLGNLEDAVALAAKKAKITDYRLMNLPEQEEAFSKILKGITNEAKSYYLKNEYGAGYSYIQELQRIKKMQGIQARMPMNPIIE